MSMGGSSIIIAKSSTKYKTQITNSQVFLGVFLWYFSNISQRISPDISRVFLGGISRGISQGISRGMSRGIISGISRGVSQVLDQRGSRCDEDQDATRIKTCKVDVPELMHQG